MTLLANWRLWVCASLLAGGAWAGWNLKPIPPPIVQTVEVAVEKVVTRTVIRKVYPDGTTEETTTDSVLDKSSSTASKELASRLPRYSVAANIHLVPETAFSKKPDWDLMGYRRLGETSAWAGVGYSQANKAILVGLRIDF